MDPGFQKPGVVDNNRFIITGGPGSGKTALIEGLNNLGYTGFPEIARDLINQGITPQITSDKADRGLFFNLILEQRISLHQQIADPQIAFYDRGIPDSLAYFKFQHLRIPHRLMEAVDTYRYHTKVFVLPPWEEIYANDSIRKESFNQSVALYELTIEAYQQSGYEVVLLPKVSHEERLAALANYAPFGR